MAKAIWVSVIRKNAKTNTHRFPCYQLDTADTEVFLLRAWIDNVALVACSTRSFIEEINATQLCSNATAMTIGKCQNLWNHKISLKRIEKVEVLHSQPGLHKLWYPGIRDRSTWKKFGAHGEYWDVFLFSNLGALWFSENLIRYSLQICLREVKDNLFSFKNSYLQHFSWRF